MDKLREDISDLLNKYSKENGSNTPDFILAEYLVDCLSVFDKAIKCRDKWYGFKSTLGLTNPTELPPPTEHDHV